MYCIQLKYRTFIFECFCPLPSPVNIQHWKKKPVYAFYLYTFMHCGFIYVWMFFLLSKEKIIRQRPHPTLISQHWTFYLCVLSIYLTSHSSCVLHGLRDGMQMALQEPYQIREANSSGVLVFKTNPLAFHNTKYTPIPLLVLINLLEQRCRQLEINFPFVFHACAEKQLIGAAEEIISERRSVVAPVSFLHFALRMRTCCDGS